MSDQEDGGPYFATFYAGVYFLAPKIEKYLRLVEQDATAAAELEEELLDKFKQIIQTDDAYQKYKRGIDKDPEDE